MALTRCSWPGDDALYVAYHDDEWGVPEHDDDALFEKLILDGFQAGLSWITILRRRDAFRRALFEFDAQRLARLTARDRTRLYADASIIRNRAKIDGTRTNARAYLAVQEHGSFDAFLWQFVDGAPQQNRWKRRDQVPAETPASQAMAKALRANGFVFVGPTICYAFMQAVGMVNDHVVDCFRHSQLDA
jgi:DNA-3-methyladenine glycosylase I